uniref:Uncharacterized protein n=1 Tax=Arundo donax TaxID=35708 RepID=A0A0A8Y217_ARUDO
MGKARLLPPSMIWLAVDVFPWAPGIALDPHDTQSILWWSIISVMLDIAF